MCRSAQGYGQDLAKEGPRASAAVAGLCVRLCVAVHVRGSCVRQPERFIVCTAESALENCHVMSTRMVYLMHPSLVSLVSWRVLRRLGE